MIAGSLLIFPVALFCWLCLNFTVPVPVYEGYNFLDFLINFIKADNGSAKLSVFFQPYPNYTLYLEHLIFLLLYVSMDYIDFRFFTALNVLSTLALAGLVAYQFKSSKYFVFLLLVIVSLWLFPQPTGQIAWAVGGAMTNLTLILIFLSLLFLVRLTPISLSAAVILGVLGLHGSTNAVFLMPAVLFLLFLLKASGTESGANGLLIDRKKAKRYFLLYVAILLFCSIPYYYAFNLFSALSLTPSLKSPDIFERLIYIIKLFGAGFAFEQQVLSIILGILFLWLTGYLWIKNSLQRFPVLSAYFFILVGSMVMIAIARDWTRLPYFSHGSRYIYFSMQAWIILLCLLLEYTLPKIASSYRLSMTALLLITVLCIGLVFSYNRYLPDYKDACKVMSKNSQQIWELAASNSVIPESHDQYSAYPSMLREAIHSNLVKPELWYERVDAWYFTDKMACTMTENDLHITTLRFRRSTSRRTRE